MRPTAAAAILPLVRRSSSSRSVAVSNTSVVRRCLSSVASRQTIYSRDDDDPASVATASPAVVAKVANGLAVASTSQRKVEIAKFEERTPARFPKAAADPELNHEGGEEVDTEGRGEETQFVSPDHVTYAGGVDLPITSDLDIVLPERDVVHPWPVFRLIDEDGSIRPSIPLDSPLLTEDVLYDPPTALRAHRNMVRLTQMDHILQNAQRQGRISFYMSCRGEESMHIGSAANLTLRDPVLAQYREAGVLMWRGFTLEQFADQCFSNGRDLGRGRQMPVHYGSRALNYHTISSPLGTQIPQAVGVAYKLKLDNMNATSEDEKACAVTYFGDGAASTGDFHTACNFAATLEVPVIFFCRNNGYAISTPTVEQYRGDGIIGRAPGYGMAALRVDGNDILAVSAAMRAAREYAIRESKPIMIEAMTYRQSHHSTSDDSTRYRSIDEIRRWEEGGSDPVVRWRRFLTREVGWMVDDEEHTRMADEERMAVLRAMELAENKAKPDLSTLFEDVYVDKPKHLERQEREHLEHVARHVAYYDADHH